MIRYGEWEENLIDPRAWILVSLGLEECECLLEVEEGLSIDDWAYQVFEAWCESTEPCVQYDFHSDSAGGGYSVSYWKSGDLLFAQDEVELQRAFRSFSDLLESIPFETSGEIGQGNFHQLSIRNKDEFEAKRAIERHFAIGESDPDFGPGNRMRPQIAALRLWVDKTLWRISANGEWTSQVREVRS